MGTDPRTGDGKFDGESFWAGPLDASLQTSLLMLCIIVYIEQWEFHYNMRQTIANGTPDAQCPGQTRVLFKFRQPDDLFHTLKTVKELLHLVPLRTPRNSVYGVLYTCGLCYMLFMLYV